MIQLDHINIIIIYLWKFYDFNFLFVNIKSELKVSVNFISVCVVPIKSLIVPMNK